MTLEFSYISEVFPDFGHSLSEKCSENCHLEVQCPDYYNEEKNSWVDIIKPGQKLRILSNGKLVIDNRFLQCIMRRITGDNRWKILEKLNTSFILDRNIIDKVSIPYSKDKKWINKINQFLK